MYQEVYNQQQNEYIFLGGCLRPDQEKVSFHVQDVNAEECNIARKEYKDFRSSSKGVKAILSRVLKSGNVRKDSKLHHLLSRGKIPFNMNVHHEKAIKYGGENLDVNNMILIHKVFHDVWHEYVLDPMRDRIIEIFAQNKTARVIMVLPKMPAYVNEINMMDALTPSEQKTYLARLLNQNAKPVPEKKPVIQKKTPEIKEQKKKVLKKVRDRFYQRKELKKNPVGKTKASKPATTKSEKETLKKPFWVPVAKSKMQEYIRSNQIKNTKGKIK